MPGDDRDRRGPLPDGATAAIRLAEGFTVATVASDLVHLEKAAAAHLDAARG
ncbi:hypothetical protein [Spirillospora sp. CA-128828]|uniref:hypothetical protein n=1 Tax=Spirillospora sp. CA-128828 TaxID=3240033 RepID=UPI003D8FB407